MIDKSEYAKWLAFEIDFNERYHNHKETMAWVATALYVSGIIVLGYKAGDIFKSFGWAVGTTVLVLLVACLIFCFVKMHFDMRWYAADAVHVLDVFFFVGSDDCVFFTDYEYPFTEHSISCWAETMLDDLLNCISSLRAFCLFEEC